MWAIAKKLHPEKEWLPWLFPPAPRFFWSDKKNQKAYLSWLFEQQRFSEPSDWYYLSFHSVSILYLKFVYRLGTG
jgi:hypothetical protein